jgi:hypothetical protein
VFFQSGSDEPFGSVRYPQCGGESFDPFDRHLPAAEAAVACVEVFIPVGEHIRFGQAALAALSGIVAVEMSRPARILSATIRMSEDGLARSGGTKLISGREYPARSFLAPEAAQV